MPFVEETYDIIVVGARACRMRGGAGSGAFGI